MRLREIHVNDYLLAKIVEERVLCGEMGRSRSLVFPSTIIISGQWSTAVQQSAFCFLTGSDVCMTETEISFRLTENETKTCE